MKEKFIRRLIFRENTEKGVLYYNNIGSKEEMKRRKKGKVTGKYRRGGERKPGIVQEVGN